MNKLKQHLPKDRYKQLIRYGHWKACVLNSGKIELCNVHNVVGISEQTNVAESNREVVEFIAHYLKEYGITEKFFNISKDHF